MKAITIMTYKQNRVIKAPQRHHKWIEPGGMKCLLFPNTSGNDATLVSNTDLENYLAQTYITMRCLSQLCVVLAETKTERKFWWFQHLIIHDGCTLHLFFKRVMHWFSIAPFTFTVKKQFKLMHQNQWYPLFNSIHSPYLSKPGACNTHNAIQPLTVQSEVRLCKASSV